MDRLVWAQVAEPERAVVVEPAQAAEQVREQVPVPEWVRVRRVADLEAEPGLVVELELAVVRALEPELQVAERVQELELRAADQEPVPAVARVRAAEPVRLVRHRARINLN